MEEASSQKPAFDYGELTYDEGFTKQMNNFDTCLDKAGASIHAICGSDVYSKLSTADKIQYDLFVAYSLNSLYWMYLRIRGVNPNETGIKNELVRIQTSMNRSQKVRDRKTVQPRLDKEVAQRFVRSGLWAPTKLVTDLKGDISIGPSGIVQAKKKIFVDNILSEGSDLSNIDSCHNNTMSNGNGHADLPPLLSRNAKKRLRKAQLKIVVKDTSLEPSQLVKEISFVDVSTGKNVETSQLKSKKRKKNSERAASNVSTVDVGVSMCKEMEPSSHLNSKKRKKSSERAASNVSTVDVGVSTCKEVEPSNLKSKKSKKNSKYQASNVSTVNVDVDVSMCKEMEPFSHLKSKKRKKSSECAASNVSTVDLGVSTCTEIKPCNLKSKKRKKNSELAAAALSVEEEVRFSHQTKSAKSSLLKGKEYCSQSVVPAVNKPKKKIVKTVPVDSISLTTACSDEHNAEKCKLVNIMDSPLDSAGHKLQGHGHKSRAKSLKRNKFAAVRVPNKMPIDVINLD